MQALRHRLVTSFFTRPRFCIVKEEGGNGSRRLVGHCRNMLRLVGLFTNLEPTVDRGMSYHDSVSLTRNADKRRMKSTHFSVHPPLIPHPAGPGPQYEGCIGTICCCGGPTHSLANQILRRRNKHQVIIPRISNPAMTTPAISPPFSAADQELQPLSCPLDTRTTVPLAAGYGDKIVVSVVYATPAVSSRTNSTSVRVAVFTSGFRVTCAVVLEVRGSTGGG